MIAALIALYGAGMMTMALMIRMADVDNPRKWAAATSILFWPFVVVACYIIAAIEMINEARKGK